MNNCIKGKLNEKDLSYMEKESQNKTDKYNNEKESKRINKNNRIKYNLKNYWQIKEINFVIHCDITRK